MRRLLPALLAATLLTACGGGGATPQVTAEDDPVDPEPASANGPSVPQFVVGEEYPGTPSTLGGTTHLAGNGCWHLTMLDDVAMIAFPTGAELGDNGDAVDLPGGASGSVAGWCVDAGSGRSGGAADRAPSGTTRMAGGGWCQRARRAGRCLSRTTHRCGRLHASDPRHREMRRGSGPCGPR